MKEYLFLGGPWDGRFLPAPDGADRIPIPPSFEKTVPFIETIPPEPEPKPLEVYCKDIIWMLGIRYEVFVFYLTARNEELARRAGRLLREREHAART